MTSTDTHSQGQGQGQQQQKQPLQQLQQQQDQQHEQQLQRAVRQAKLAVETEWRARLCREVQRHREEAQARQQDCERMRREADDRWVELTDWLADITPRFLSFRF